MHQAYDRCKKVNRCNFNRNWPHQRIEIGRLGTQFQCFWGEFRRPLAALDRCTLNKGAFAFKIVRGALKWPLKGGSRLIEVAATAGLTVDFEIGFNYPKFHFLITTFVYTYHFKSMVKTSSHSCQVC